MTSTIRQCDCCSYKTLILDDENFITKCHKCKTGNLEIIAKGEFVKDKLK